MDMGARLGAVLSAVILVMGGCAARPPEPYLNGEMAMIVEDNYSVRLGGTWVDGKAQIEAALNRVHAINPKMGITIVSGARAQASDMDAMVDMIKKAGMLYGTPDIYPDPH